MPLRINHTTCPGGRTNKIETLKSTKAGDDATVEHHECIRCGKQVVATRTQKGPFDPVEVEITDDEFEVA